MAASHLSNMLTPKEFEKKCRRVIQNMKALQKRTRFDCLVFSGLSGALIAPVVSRSLKVNMIPIRKGEDCHSCSQVEYLDSISYKKAIIFDDLVESGKTINYIMGQLDEAQPNIQIIGIALHRRLDHYPTDTGQGGTWKNRSDSRAIPIWYV